MSKYKYFIKTEQEFIDEFGSNWRNDCCNLFCFISSMNYLFGTEIDSNHYNHLLVNNKFIKGIIYIPMRDDGFGINWKITRGMVKEVLFTPTYNEKRKLVYD